MVFVIKWSMVEQQQQKEHNFKANLNTAKLLWKSKKEQSTYLWNLFFFQEPFFFFQFNLPTARMRKWLSTMIKKTKTKILLR